MSRCWKTQKHNICNTQIASYQCKSTKELINNSTGQVEIENTKSKLQVHLTLVKS